MSNDFYKNNESDTVWWVDTDKVGVWEFSFDRKKTYNLFADFPDKLTKEEVRMFIKENPYWAHFFRDRLQDYDI